MDLATIIGMIGALAVIALAMVFSGGIGMYMDLPSVLIVIVGGLFVVMIKFGLGQFLGAARIAVKAFSFKSIDPSDLIDELVDLAEVARKGGLLSLEGREVSNEFLHQGIQLLVDGHEPDVVRRVLHKDMGQALDRHERGAAIFASIAEVGPAMGMIGTLIGLVAMLGNMNDPKSIGPAMAVALLTTLYGAVMGTMVAGPIGDKLRLRRGEEALNKQLIIDALLAIQGGQNPRVIDAMLRNYLPSRQRVRADEV